jgi:hypothetical protein
MAELNKKWVDALDVATSKRCSKHMELSPRIANAMIGASEFQTRILQELQKKIDLYPPDAFYDFQRIPIACYKEIIELVKTLVPEATKPKISEVDPLCTIKHGCPECGGDVFDGTGTGWRLCHKCGLMF